MQKKNKRGLGKGLSALLGDFEDIGFTENEEKSSIRTISIMSLTPGEYQPREGINIHTDELESLAQSIKEHGVLQPILVRKLEESDKFEIIAGERRWHAAQKAELQEVPVIIKDLSNKQTLEIALVENLQRKDLTVLEEAEAYKQLMDEFSHTQDQLAKVVGKSRSHIANILRLLSLPTSVKQLLNEGKITAGHAKVLLNSKHQEEIIKQILKDNLNVRQTEALVRKFAFPEKRHGKIKQYKNENLTRIEQDLTQLIGLQVNIQPKKAQAGVLNIKYSSMKELDDLLVSLSHASLINDKEAA